MPYVGRLGHAGIGKEGATPGVLVAPTEFLPFIPPENIFPAITLLESTAIRGLADTVYKAYQGPGDVKNMKMKWEAEAENIGNLLMAAFSSDTISGPTDSAAYTHHFLRSQQSQLKSYTWWIDQGGGGKYKQVAGCMLNKLELDIKSKEALIVDSEWTGLLYDDTGITHAPSYSAVQPFKFNMAKITVAGSQINNYESLKITIDNMVESDHVINQSIYPGKIYSKGMKVTLAATLVFEDTTEYEKFLAGSSTSFVLNVNHSAIIPGCATTPYSLTINIPLVYYNAAPFPSPDGLLKIAFTGTGVYSPGSAVTADAYLVNSITPAY